MIDTSSARAAGEQRRIGSRRELHHQLIDVAPAPMLAGSIDVIMECCVAWKCLVACRFFESSQQPTCPQVLQSRRWTQVSPSLRYSSQPRLRGGWFAQSLSGDTVWG